MPTRASLKTEISRWENGHVVPQQPYIDLLAEIYEAAPAELGIGGGVGLWLPSCVLPSPRTHTTPDLVRSMEELLTSYAQADNDIGPGGLTAAVLHHIRELDAVLRKTRGSLRADVLRLCSRYAEFAGWLCQDAGDLRGAAQWTDQALDFLEESADFPERAYVLMRKSAVAADRGELTRSVSLATAASKRPKELPERLNALILRQSAVSHALVQDSRRAECSAVSALESVARAESSPDRLKYCTEPYVLMEAGFASYNLRRFDEAAERLRDASRTWPDGYPRDRGLCLARLALAEAARGNVDAACVAGVRAVDLVAATSSARGRGAIRALAKRLAPHSGHTVVSEFEDRMTMLS